MAVTYADLVAFGFAYVEDNVLANVKKQKLSVRTTSTPLLSSEDTCLCEEEDFIVFAEFSEVKGPVALFTVPSYIQQDDKVDINSFIMRIMSIDYQANPGGQFCISQDTQSLQSHVSLGRHVYAHYFTLYDLHARGFVRPLCVAYVSSNYYKLHRIFPQLREHFLKVTESVKVNNRQNFKNEILSVLRSITDIEEDAEILKEEHTKSGPLNNIPRPKNLKGQQLQQYEDFSFMLKAVEASLIGVEYTIATLDHWQAALTFSDESPVPKELQDYLTLISSESYQNTNVKFNEGVCMLDKQLRPLPILCPWGTAWTLSQLLSILQNFGSCELSTSSGCFPALSSIQQVGHSLVSQQESQSAWEALGKAEFLELLQAIAVGALEASIPSQEDQDCDHADGSSSKEGTSGNEGSSSYHSFSDSNCDPMAKVTEIGDSQFSAFKEVSDVTLEKTIGQSIEEKEFTGYWPSNDKDILSLKNGQCKEDFHSIIDSCSLEHSINSLVNDKTAQCSDVGRGPITSSDSSSDDSESFHDILEALHSDDNWSIESSDEVLPLGVPWNHCLWTRHKPIRKAGHRLLKFFWTYRSAAQHIVYSLLTGRTLVLTGDSSSEQRVSRIMNALSPLIPPLDDNGLRVLRWHQGILVSAHIASYQLIGMCIPERLSVHDMISPRDKNSVTILDVNTEQLLGPAYHGHLLAPIGNNVHDFPSDHSLLLYIESVFFGIGRKLQSYKALVSACKNELPSHACRQLDIHGCDADVIRYLSKLSL